MTLGTLGSPEVVSRFAPAPTGLLHLGHIVNAIYVWGVTRLLGGRVLLRIEDHDRRRSRPEFEQAMLEDLEWLGFVADRAESVSAPATRLLGKRQAARPIENRQVARPFKGRDDVIRQSDRHAVYESALSRLRSNGLVYSCECSRSEIAVAGEPGLELRYPGTCAAKGLPEGGGRGTRVRLEPSIERFDDRRHGPQEQRPAEQCGDLLVRDRDGNWTYQFAVTVDDIEQGVTLVIRGDDLLASTGRQIQLARLLGRFDPPDFLHHPLIMKSAAQKLSKSDGDTSIRDLRARGWTSPQVIGHAAALVGLRESGGELGATAVTELFRTPH